MINLTGNRHWLPHVFAFSTHSEFVKHTQSGDVYKKVDDEKEQH